MIISMIAAMAHQRVIGANNAMPWHLPADLKHFKKLTLGKPIIMGRRTYASIGKALPGRLNIVLSSDPDFVLEDARVVNSCEAGLALAQAHLATSPEATNEVMIIGGGTLYQHFLPLCQRLYLTLIDLNVEGDTYFPDYLAHASWVERAAETMSADPQNPYDYQFIILEKRA